MLTFLSQKLESNYRNLFRNKCYPFVFGFSPPSITAKIHKLVLKKKLQKNW